MAVYIPASRRRRLAMSTTALAVLLGLGAGFVVGRVSARGVDDAVADARQRAGDAATALARLPIEYEQHAQGSGGETASKMVASIRAARSLLADAEAAAPWLGADTRAELEQAVGAVLADVRADVPLAAFETHVRTAASTINRAFGTREGQVD